MSYSTIIVSIYHPSFKRRCLSQPSPKNFEPRHLEYPPAKVPGPLQDLALGSKQQKQDSAPQEGLKSKHKQWTSKTCPGKNSMHQSDFYAWKMWKTPKNKNWLHLATGIAKETAFDRY